MKERKPVTAQFKSRVKKVGINPCVDPPVRVTAVFGIRGYIPVRGTVNGKAFRQTLVPIGGGRHRLFINGPMMNSARLQVGDTIAVTLRIDRQSREEPMPPKMKTLLATNIVATKNWNSLTPSRRKEILRYLNSAKRMETFERNLIKVITILEGKRVRMRPAAVRA
jgi:hypothetical protein